MAQNDPVYQAGQDVLVFEDASHAAMATSHHQLHDAQMERATGRQVVVVRRMPYDDPPHYELSTGEIVHHLRLRPLPSDAA